MAEEPENRITGDVRRGAAKKGRETRKRNLARKAAREELSDLDDVIKSIEKERPSQVQKSVAKFFERKVDDKTPAWETEGKGMAPEGEFLTLEDLIHLKPFTFEDMNSTVAFRTNDKMMRAFQRLKEASGRTYDIMSDLYRDAATIGLLVLSERHKQILGTEIAISRAEAHQQTVVEARDDVFRLKEALKPLSPDLQRSYFDSFVEALDAKPRWIQEASLEEIRGDKMLALLLQGIEEPE